MKTRLFAALLIASAFIASPAIAREPVPIVNYVNVAVATNSGKTPSREQVKQAILTAAGTKNWTVAQQADGKLLGTLHVRGKHTIIVEIAYSAENYSLTYKDSTNMKFGELDGQQVIHPFYTRWVQGLMEAIRIELLKS